MGARIGVLPAPAPRHRAEREAATIARVSRLIHALAWVTVLAGGAVLVAMAVQAEHGRTSASAVFGVLMGAIAAGLALWCTREIRRPAVVAPTAEEVPMGKHPTAVNRARIAAAFRMHGHPTAAAHARIAAAFRTHGRHTRYVVRTPRLAHEARHAVATTPITVNTKGRIDA